jgi:phosphoribosylanthranilate isomerase
MRTRLKVCCIASPDEARLAVRLGADALGLVAGMPSGPGPIADDQIREIARQAPPGVATWLLTCRTEPGAVLAHVLHTGVNTVQLVDAVDPAVYALLRDRAPWVRIVQVLHVEDARVLDDARRLAGLVDGVLLDSGRPSAPVKELGGTGRVHDWALSAKVVQALPALPVFLAGGIRPENVAEAVHTVRPYGIDLCTGVRTEGRLDADKLSRLVDAIRRADAG